MLQHVIGNWGFNMLQLYNWAQDDSTPYRRVLGDLGFLAHQPNYCISFLKLEGFRGSNLFEIPDFMDLTSFDNNGLQEYLAETVNRAIDMSIHSHIFQHAHRTRALFKP